MDNAGWFNPATGEVFELLNKPATATNSVKCEATGCNKVTKIRSKEWSKEWSRVWVDATNRSYDSCSQRCSDKIRKEHGCVTDAEQLKLFFFL